MNDVEQPTSVPRRPWRSALEVFWVFLQIGSVAIGGPSATQGLVFNRIVAELQWMDREPFMKLLGLVNLLPGPNAVQVAMHVGHRRAGKAGFILGGLGFMLPGALIAVVLAFLYVRYQATPPMVWLLYAMKPVIIAVTAWATVRMARGANVRSGRIVVIIAAGAAYLAGVDETLVLVVAAVVVAAVAAGRRRGARTADDAAKHTAGLLPMLLLAPGRLGGTTWPEFVVVFLKAGALLFGGGTVVLAVLRGELVVHRGWITDTQLLDAVTLGQATPGPVLNSVTFIGYLLAGPVGAVVATVAVLLPSYLVMTIAQPLLRLIDRWPIARAGLDGVVLAVIGVIAGVTLQLGRGAVTDVFTAVLAVTAVLVLWWRPKASLLVMAGGALVGLVCLVVDLAI